jgi:bifunctional non-homologous end joining protein LigD
MFLPILSLLQRMKDLLWLRAFMRGVAPAVIGALAVSLVQIAPPDGAEWLHDIKFDGYRMHARVEGGRARLLTRTDLDWTSKYLAIADAATALPLGSAYTHGESCGVRADGITSFSLIQNASDTRNGEALVIFQFDLLHVDGEDPSALPLVERKAS